MSVKKRNFKESIRHLFLLYTFMPILILFLLFLMFTVLNSKYIVANKTKEANKEISQSLTAVYNDYYEEINRMSISPLIIDFANTRLDSQKVYEEFYEFNNHQKVKSVFHIIDAKGVFLASSAPSDPNIHEMVFQNIVPRIEKVPTATLTEANKVRYSYDRYTVYTFGRVIVNDDRIAGYIVYQLYEEDVQKLIFVRNNEIAVITDSYHTIIATTNNITKGLMNKFKPMYDSKGYVKLNDGKYYVSLENIPFAQMNVYTLNSIEYQEYSYISLGVFTLVTSLFVWFLLRFLANKMSFRHTRSIDKLLYAVNQLQQGNLLSYVQISTGDEFETLGNQYNIMLNRLNNLLKKNEELMNIRRLIEVKQLQAQFHPHFIFNILETLRYAIVVDSHQAQEIVMILSRLLRYSINNDGQTVVLKDDLNHVGDYLKLQQIRFKERLKFEVHVSDEGQNALVPKLLVQAIIENSIKYGYKNQQFLFISIRGYVENQDLIIEVEDNGYGMSEERLNQVREIVNNPDNRTQHIGLNNVHRRLVLLYGENYGVQIESVLGTGTCVRIAIPYEMGDNRV